VTADANRTGYAATADPYTGRMPTHAGDLAIETHGIAPIPPENRYGTARRLFTVWFAPQVNVTVLFTGTLAVVLGLGFWLGLLAMVIGTVLGSLAVGYLSTWGPRTGTAQLPNARMAFGPTVPVVAVIQWLSSIAWEGLVGLFGGEALAELLGIPFWLAVMIVLATQAVVGVFGYEVIHRMQAVMTVVLFVTFAVFAVKLVSGNEIISAPTLAGPPLARRTMSRPCAGTVIIALLPPITPPAWWMTSTPR
jgi:NCS1 family nucleobase:cation symporter-1